LTSASFILLEGTYFIRDAVGYDGLPVTNEGWTLKIIEDGPSSQSNKNEYLIRLTRDYWPHWESKEKKVKRYLTVIGEENG